MSAQNSSTKQIINCAAYILCFVVFFTITPFTNATDSFVKLDTLTPFKIDSIFKGKQYKKVVIIKRKTSDTTQVFNFGKKTKELHSILTISKRDHISYRYYYFEGNLVKLIYLAARSNTDRSSGIYYFSKGSLVYKKEYNMKELNIYKFLEESENFSRIARSYY